MDLQKHFKLGTIKRLVHQVGVEDTVGNKSVALDEFLSTSACLETMVRLAVEMVDPGLPEGSSPWGFVRRSSSRPPPFWATR